LKIDLKRGEEIIGDEGRGFRKNLFAFLKGAQKDTAQK
jgi:hypothetical protein